MTIHMIQRFLFFEKSIVQFVAITCTFMINRYKYIMLRIVRNYKDIGLLFDILYVNLHCYFSYSKYIMLEYSRWILKVNVYIMFQKVIAYSGVNPVTKNRLIDHFSRY